MDKTLRNTLRNTVAQCRRLLETAITEVLEGQFGIHRSGTVEAAVGMAHLSAEDQAYRMEVLAHLQHIEASGLKRVDAVAQLIREVAYTHLNRLCAYKMLEQRKLIREAVSRGFKSNGFMFYLADYPAEHELSISGKTDLAYRHFLEWQASELSQEIGALFSPHDPANRLFPPQRVLDQVLALLNSDELQAVWHEDETIGWVYQYFTPPELRDQARKESAAPRNSYELAFRNQFYTPRYVVQFLVENTLGRTWFEMRQGDTALRDQCQYLVWRPDEIGPHPVAARHPSPIAMGEGTGVRAIPHRTKTKRDPRTLRILDPACGSGHFLLGCFDVLQTIYEEAYTDDDLGPALQADYPTLDDFRAAVPGLILRHNLYGIDIDLRAMQIASLALWLRAQRAYAEYGIKGKARPRITRVNIVHAEPMPGERELLKDFVQELQPPLLGQLVEVIFDKMKLAGEAGSLLKIEAEIRNAIAEAKERWQRQHMRATDRYGQEMLFSRVEMDGISRRIAEQGVVWNVAEITDEEFWQQAEGCVLDALHEFARRAADHDDFRRTLFADDAARGFAFIDVSRKVYDVVLMNPPFGAASKESVKYIERAYPRTKNDVYAAFVERGIELLRRGGMLGAITSRTGFFLTSFKRWREEILLKEARPTVVADLGMGVLDTAMVETAAYCLEVVQ